MAETPQQIVDRELREFKRYTGDGLPGEPVSAPLPVGDPQSGVHNPKKVNLRNALKASLEGGAEQADRAQAEADRAEAEANRSASEADRAHDEADRAEDEADRAAGYVNDIVDEKEVPITATRNGMEALEFPAGMSAIETRGFDSVGDGGNGIYLHSDNEPNVEDAFKVQTATGAWYWLKMDRVNPLQAGADPSGAQSSSIAFRQAFAHAIQTGAILDIPAGEYSSGFLNIAIPEGRSLAVEMHPGATLNMPGPSVGIRIAGPGPGATAALLANVVLGDFTFDCATEFTPGQTVLVGDEYRPVANRCFQGEIKTIIASEAISGGYRMTVDSAFSPMIASEGYTVSRSAFVQLYGMAGQCDLDFAGTVMGGGSDADQSAAIQLRDIKGLNFRTGLMKEFARRGVQLSSCLMGYVEGYASEINRITDLGDNELGYAFMVAEASEHIRFNIHAERCGKLFDNGENQAGRFGTSRHIDVTGSHKAPIRQGFGTHSGGEYFHFHDILIDASATAWAGCYHRMAHLTLDNIHIRDIGGNMSRGIYAINNGQQGDISITNSSVSGGSLRGISVLSRESEGGSGTNPDENESFTNIYISNNVVTPSAVTGNLPNIGLDVRNEHAQTWPNAGVRGVSSLSIQGGSYAGENTGVFLDALGGNINNATLHGVKSIGGVDGLRARHNNGQNRYVQPFVSQGGNHEGGSGYGAVSEGGAARGAVYGRMRGGTANQSNLAGYMNIGASANTAEPHFSEDPVTP